MWQEGAEDCFVYLPSFANTVRTAAPSKPLIASFGAQPCPSDFVGSSDVNSSQSRLDDRYLSVWWSLGGGGSEHNGMVSSLKAQPGECEAVFLFEQADDQRTSRVLKSTKKQRGMGARKTCQADSIHPDWKTTAIKENQDASCTQKSAPQPKKKSLK